MTLVLRPVVVLALKGGSVMRCTECFAVLTADERDVCGDCIGEQLYRAPCPRCGFPMGDTDPPEWDGEPVCPGCYEHARERASC